MSGISGRWGSRVPVVTSWLQSRAFKRVQGKTVVMVRLPARAFQAIIGNGNVRSTFGVVSQLVSAGPNLRFGSSRHWYKPGVAPIRVSIVAVGEVCGCP